MPLSDLLAALPVIGLMLGVTYLVGLPAAMRQGFWIRPRFDTLSFDEAAEELNRAELTRAAERFDELAEELRTRGFVETDRFVSPNFASRCCVAILLAYDSRTATTAGVQMVFQGDAGDARLSLRGEYYGLSTLYESDGRNDERFADNAFTDNAFTDDRDAAPLIVQTSTSPQLFPPPPNHEFLCVDWIKSIGAVHDLHLRHCEHARQARLPERGSRVVSDRRGERDELVRRHARALAFAVEDGFLHPETPGLLRLTARGAVRVATHLMWPLATVTRTRQRIATRRRLTAWRV